MSLFDAFRGGLESRRFELNIGTKKGDPRYDEWQMVVTTAQHFNDLLMRLRAFGLPVVGTIAGAGFTLGLNNKFADVPDWTSAVVVSVNAVGVSLLVVFLLFVRHWGSEQYSPLNAAEKTMWWSVVVVALGMAVAFWSLRCAGRITLTDEHALNAGPLILFFALAVLIVLYALDRFYYYKLLLGAVSRATELEEGLGYKMTRAISEHIQPQHAASIITLLYYLPGMTSYIALLILVGLNPLIGTPSS
jgi:hypothetical protein